MDAKPPRSRNVFSLRTFFTLIAILAAYCGGWLHGTQYLNGIIHAKTRAVNAALLVELDLRSWEQELHEMQKELGRTPSAKRPGLAETGLAKYLNDED